MIDRSTSLSPNPSANCFQSLPLARSPILIEPGFGYCEEPEKLKRPTIRETVVECSRVLNVLEHRNHMVTAFNFLLQCAVFLVFLAYFCWYFSMTSMLFMVASVSFLGTVYNTVWSHRYCAHVAFEFRNPRFSLLFLWTNPLAFIFREELYAIPHRIHHQQTEKPGDPYGPHLGWLASFLAPELTQRLNIHVCEKEFELLKTSTKHIGVVTNSYINFQQTGLIESLGHYIWRVLVSQTFWIIVVSVFGGFGFLVAWYAAIFCITVLVRDFNWRGHGGNFRRVKKRGWEFDDKSHALNQYFYGYLASEWHDNHHKYPFSANNGFLPGQFDLAFQIIKLMHKVGIVKSYVDARPIFEKECLGSTVSA